MRDKDKSKMRPKFLTRMKRNVIFYNRECWWRRCRCRWLRSELGFRGVELEITMKHLKSYIRYHWGSEEMSGLEINLKVINI